jgi:dynein heavy chain
LQKVFIIFFLAGRTELPESVKALFRPCAMITPDMDLICEIMLMSEGYSNGKILSRKFMILYRLSEALLSAQKHYDWKLRAVKTTLNVAGGMLRADRESSEDRVLLRALRDFNVGKLVADDVAIFLGMLDDLFPKLRENLVRSREVEFENTIIEAARAMNLQSEDIFVLKCSQLREILAVRWSVFLIGPAGCGKSELIKVLSKAENIFGEKSTINTLNPKSVTRNELYGYIHPATREWKDGLLSQIFRDLANIHTVKHEYLVLDGDIDAEWIESMNTVMDDNKTLTLASNERIPLTPPMRLLLEVENMSQASPATVSRGGVVFMNSEDVGWKPYVNSWIQNREIEYERLQLTSLFIKYISKVFDFLSKNLKSVVPIPEISKVQHLTYILEGLIGNGEEFFQKSKQIGAEQAIILLEMLFVYAVIWSCGGSLASDKHNDHRAVFDKWFKSEFSDSIKFPEDATIFDFWVDQEMVRLTHWSQKISPYAHQSGVVFGSIFIPTVETERLFVLLGILIKYKRACMLVGGAGTGKTTLMKDRLRNMDSDIYSHMNISTNCFTDSMLLQGAMESVIEKKTGRTFGPPGSKKLIYFIDDLNMPEVDKYGTQQPIAFLRQFFDYSGWYSREKLVWREIHNVQVVSCLNPTAGSFFIDKRLQRSYCTYSVPMPTSENLEFIFLSIISGHLSNFNPDVSKTAPRIVKATIDTHKLVADQFMATAVKFHYIFNLRDISNIFEGMLRSEAQYFTTPLPLIRLWMHECDRVFSDRLITESDLFKYIEIKESVTKKWFDSENQEKLFAKPNIFTTFTSQDVNANTDLRPYCGIGDAQKLTAIVHEKMLEYNESNAVMDLVLFDVAVEHVCRITRILEKPRGNALLVGVGGSGKQSLAMLSTFIVGSEIFQITVTATYGINDFKEFLLILYRKAGAKGISCTLIMTDSQIINERFLVLLNDFLASGNIPDIFTSEIKDEFRNAIRNDARQAGVQDTPDNLWEFFIEKTRKNLHLILCFSPVGDKFRIRARQFPALVNCTTFDYFHPWPQDALVAVAQKFLTGTDGVSPDSYDVLSQLMAFFHCTVNEASEEFMLTDRRYNHTTPKSFLDLIELYKTMLSMKKNAMKLLKQRLENGLEKMQSAAEQVAELQESLIKDIALVEEKREATDNLLAFVGQETTIADEQKAIAIKEENKCAKIAEEVSAFQAECEKEMAAAEPVVQGAIEALNSLDKKSLTELKALASPPPGVEDVTAGVMVLLAGGKIPKDLSWNAAKKQMGNLDQFLNVLLTYDKNNAPVAACDWIEKNLLSKESFNPVSMKAKSSAAAGMCGWVVNIVKYYRIYEVVEPKRQLLAQSNIKLADANTQLMAVRVHVANLEAKLEALSGQFEAATAEKNEAIAQAEKTKTRASMATRLVNGLADEKIRWAKAVESFDVQEIQLAGNVLLASAFVSYVGAFNMNLRNLLVQERWLPAVIERSIPMTNGLHPLNLLADDATIAQWSNEGLPTDTMSIQNGAILCNCKRWPLLIDPQLQGVKWVKRRHSQPVQVPKAEDGPEEDVLQTHQAVKEMIVVQMSQSKYLNYVEQAISNGDAILIENLGESIDAILQPVLMRAVIKRGRAYFLKIGDKEVEYDSSFKLYLQTKMSNPHYKPEIAAQTTLINFMITVDGLQEQLLALVVNKERPDLEEEKRTLMEQQNGYKVKLKELEDELLFRLATSQGDILSDVELIEGLEKAKITSNDINARAAVAKETEKLIVDSRRAYIPVAVRGALTYFLVDQMHSLDHLYQFSMANFIKTFKKGMDLADEVDDKKIADDDAEGRALSAKVDIIVDASCFNCFAYVSQGLFECHKLVFACQLCFRILAQMGELQQDYFEFLLRAPTEAGIDNPLSEWMDEKSWGTLQSLKQFEAFERLPEDIVGSSKRFREWYELERPEDASLPGDWKKISEFQKLMILRALRPDRTAESLAIFVKKVMGAKYVYSEPFNLKRSFLDSTPSTPIFFILSPGVDPVKDTERLAKDYKIGFESGNFSLVSLGQGQEPVAEKAVETGYRQGTWAFLQNIHLTPKWTSTWLEKRSEDLEGSHPDFRLFLSAEPANLPVNLLKICVKLTNEPPEGLRLNLLKSMIPFNDDFFESSSKSAELKSICFALCLFHAIILERNKFGRQGWNQRYPFNTGDLTSSAQVALNYLESNTRVPWDDLKYIFGEIMYGGHITDFYDRILAMAYLDSYMTDELLEGIQIFPGFQAPLNSLTAKDTLSYIDANMPQESPTAFGLHVNAEIGFRVKHAEQMFADIRELQPRSGGVGTGASVQEKARGILDDIMEKMPEMFDLGEILERMEERNPFVTVFLQEIERMIKLMVCIIRALSELDLGLKGDLQISERMEILMTELAEDRVPSSWESIAYPSKRSLGVWFSDFIQRHKQLCDWSTDLGLPKVTWISGLFNPQSFLTAIMQTTARKNDWPLDKTVTQTEVTRKFSEEISLPAKDGAYVSGLIMEGARWDDKLGQIEDSRHKELFASLPIVIIRAVTAEKSVQKDVYECPVYRTQDRGPTFIFVAGLKTKAPATKWIMGGVALLMEVA